MHPFQHGEDIIIGRRRPLVVDGEEQFDAYGVLQYEAVEVLVKGCAVWPFFSTENNYNEERTNAQYNVALPHGTPVDQIDYILWLDEKYEVYGTPLIYNKNPLTGSPGPITLFMTRAEG